MNYYLHKFCSTGCQEFKSTWGFWWYDFPLRYNGHIIMYFMLFLVLANCTIAAYDRLFEVVERKRIENEPPSVFFHLLVSNFRSHRCKYGGNYWALLSQHIVSLGKESYFTKQRIKNLTYRGRAKISTLPCLTLTLKTLSEEKY